MRLTQWRHDPTHRRSVAYRKPVSRTRFSGVNRSAVEKSRDFRGFEAKLRNSTRVAGHTPNRETNRPDRVQAGNVAPTGKNGGIDRRTRSPVAVSPSSRSRSEVKGTPRKTASQSVMDDSRDENTFHGNRSGGAARGQGSRDSMATSDGAYAHGTTAKSGLGGGKWGRPPRK